MTSRTCYSNIAVPLIISYVIIAVEWLTAYSSTTLLSSSSIFVQAPPLDVYNMRLMFPKFRNDFVLMNDPNKHGQLFHIMTIIKCPSGLKLKIKNNCPNCRVI